MIHTHDFDSGRCTACKGFERTYHLIGKSLQQDGYSIGKVNIDESQALVSRFNVRYLPTLYLIRNEQVYLYDGANTFEGVVNFATQGYKDTEPIPYFSSPLGPVGSIKGLLTRLGIALVNIQPFLMKELGVSQFVSYVLTAFFFGGLVVTLVSIGVYLQVILSGHVKRD
jgi:thiol-disulfide isomerase/thioredoxin